jgi:hypothetical protein
MNSVVDYSADPFQVLNLEPTEDKKEIKRAYKRMALKHHPDMVTTQETPPEKKREVNLAFAKINWAYAQLSGKNGSTSSTYATSTSTSTTTSSTTSTSTETSSASDFYTYDPDQTSTDWRDYMPRNQVYQTYNVGRDSFDKELEDLFNGAAVGPADFFGVNYGYPNDENDNAQFQIFLKTGSVEEVGMERDDTEYTVWQLEHKRAKMAAEWRHADRRLAFTKFYLEKKELEKVVADLEAKIQGVDEYLEREHQRMSALQTRYDDLVMIGKIHGYDRGHVSRRSSSSRSTSFSNSATNSSSTKRTSSSDSTDASDTPLFPPQESSSTKGTSSNDSTASSATPPSQESPVAPPPRQHGRTASYSSASTEGGTTWTHDEFGYVYRGRPSSSYRYTPPPPPPRQESSSTRGRYSNGSTASYSSASSTEKDAWIHDEFGSVYTGRGRETRSTATGRQQRPYSVYTPPPPPRQESYSTSGTYSDEFGSSVKGHDSDLLSQGRDTQSTASSSQRKSSSSSTSLPPPNESAVTPRGQTSTTRPQSSTTTMTTKTKTRETSSDSGTASSASNEEGAGNHQGFGSRGRDFQSAASSSQRQSSSSSTPPPRRQTSTTRPQSSTTTTTRKTSSGGGTASASNEEGAGKHKGFGSRGRDSQSAASSSQRQSSSSSTPPPPRNESSVTPPHRRQTSATRPQSSTTTTTTIGTSSNGSTIRWSLRLKDDITNDTLSLAEKKILKVATWPYEFSFRQRAHCIASRMLDEYLRNPDRDKSSPPVPNPEDAEEAVALKVVEFSPSSERIQTVSTIMTEQQMEEKSRTFLNNIPFFANVKRKGNIGPVVSAVKQGANKFVSMRRGSRRRS